MGGGGEKEKEVGRVSSPLDQEEEVRRPGEEKGEEHPEARGEEKTSPTFKQCCASWQNHAHILETTRPKTPRVPPLTKVSPPGGRKQVRPHEVDPPGVGGEKCVISERTAPPRQETPPP